MLTVYRASAGSGKTYTLTGEYLKLLFDKNNSFRRILAVTFTNKATDEMKSRIIHELDVLARGAQSGFLSVLMSEFSMTEEQVYRRAHQILLEILHDYSSFNISTIDRFFQQTMRAFAREIGLQGGYNVELDTNRVLTEAVDKMLFSLDQPDNKELLEWLLKFAEDKIENGKSWNIKREIIDLGKELFKEEYQRLSPENKEKLRDKEALKSYLSSLNAIIKEYENRLKEYGAEGLNLMKKFGFEPEHFGGSGAPMKRFLKWEKGVIDMPSETFRKIIDNPDSWKPAGKYKEYDSAIKSAYSGGLNDCVRNVVAHLDDSIAYNSAKIIRSNIYTLGILTDIDLRIKELVAENNIMLLSDTTQLLNRLIDGSDTPFIYEKIGVRIEHYMIDEFQDTSQMQWQNFSPLIHESLAHDNPDDEKLSNLIVGDVKQSIYRWRSSDWKLLNEQLGEEFAGRISDKVLDDNWRSTAAIIGFNNAFFTRAAKELQQLLASDIPEELHAHTLIQPYLTKIEDAYRDVYQRMPANKEVAKGHVRVEWVEKTEDTSWKEEVLEKIPLQIIDWQKRGYALRDMAILVRGNDEGGAVASALLKYKQEHPESEYAFDVISDEALIISKANVIKLLIALLKQVRQPDNVDYKRLAMIEYAIYQRPGEDAVGDFFAGAKSSVELEFAPELEEELLKARQLPLFEMCERLISLFVTQPTATDSLYLQTFQDLVLDFSNRKTADLIAFLDWWEESGYSKKVIMPNSQNAIRIMTIHKSKGLGFKCVIIPFCGWNIDQKANSLIWCEPNGAPFDQLPLLPIPYKQELSRSIFSFEYYEEKLHAYIDNLNLAYVAFTRAKEELVIFAEKKSKVSKSDIGDLLLSCMNDSSKLSSEGKDFILLNDFFNSEAMIYEDGVGYSPKFEESEHSLEEHAAPIRSINPDGRLQLKLRSRDFFADTDERRLGKMMHEVLSRISTYDDISKAVDEFVFSGEISSEDAFMIVLRLRYFILDSKASFWFTDEWKVLNEIDILLPGGVHYRPDRVVISDDEVNVIDFKFGQQKSKKHHRQVANYVSLVEQMGYSNVSGYIWYVTLEEIEEVVV